MDPYVSLEKTMLLEKCLDIINIRFDHDFKQIIQKCHAWLISVLKSLFSFFVSLS